MTMAPVKEAWFEGVVSLRRGEGFLQPLRLKEEEIPLHNETFVAMASTPGGARLRFSTDSPRIRLSLMPFDGEAERRFDLTTDAKLLQTVALEPGENDVVFEALPGNSDPLELWFPTHQEVRIRGIEVADGAEVVSAPDGRPRWVTYGSSITHCGAAFSPSRTWPAVAARMRGLNVTSLGYAGQCHLDPLVALMIRDLPADFISLKVGINMVGGSVSQRTFRPLLTGMVRILREKHPTTPIAVVSPIVSPPREETPGATGMTLGMMRRELEIAVERLRECGDARVYYFSGLDLFDASLVAEYLPDQVHPNGGGYEILGRNFAEKVIDRLDLAGSVSGGGVD